MISYDWVNFDKERYTAEKLGVTEYGRVVLQAAERRVDIPSRKIFNHRPVRFIGESVINAKLSMLVREKIPSVGVLKGVSEFDATSSNVELRRVIEQAGATFSDIDLLDSPDALDGIDLLLVINPVRSAFAGQRELIGEFLRSGGNLLLTLDDSGFRPNWMTAFTPIEGILSSSKSLETDWRKTIATPEPMDGLQLQKMNVILDSVVVFQHPEIFQGVPVHSLFPFKSRDWVEKSTLSTTQSPSYDEEDWRGSGSFGAVLEYRKTGSRQVVLGDGDWLNSAVLQDYPTNQIFASALVSWLLDTDIATTEDRVILLPKLMITRNQLQYIRPLALLFIPVLTLVIGFSLLQRRRRQS